ncbi:MAG TPA: hypothetical protein VGK52_18990 [Polyangia bacterium]|jgi:hypothetical protein
MRARSVRRPATLVLTLVLSTVLVSAGARPAQASGQSNSGSTSSDSSNSKDSNSSNGSNDSSKSSGDSSHNSQGSSKDSNNSTQNSPKSSSDWSTNSSSDWSTHSHGAHVFSIALVVVAVGATVVGVMATNATQRQQRQQATTALAAFMRRQHPLLTHDVAMADGPVLAAWAHDLRLAPADRARLRGALEGSSEQGVLLEALAGPIDEAGARRFATAYLRVAERALGAARTRALIERAVRAVGLG